MANGVTENASGDISARMGPGDGKRPGHGRDRTRYQADLARMRAEIVTLLNYPRVGALDANAIAINLGTLKEQIEPLLAQLAAVGEVRQVDHDRYAGRDAQPAAQWN